MQEGCKLPSRHGHVTWFGTNAYVQGTPRLFRSPSCTTPPRRCRQAKASAHKTPSLVHCHRLSRSPGRNPLQSFSTKEGVSSSPVQSVGTAPHQIGGSSTGCFACLGKTSLKLALSRTKPIQVHKALSQSFSQARYSTKHF